jgi:hypothetical protein
MVGGYALFLWKGTQTPLIGLLTTFPLFAFSLIPPKFTGEQQEYRSVYRLVAGATIGFLGLMLAVWPAFGGKQWGARYLLPVYPLLLYLAFWGYTSLVRNGRRENFRRLVSIAASILLVSSILLQLTSLYMFNTIRQEGLQTIRWMNSVAVDVVVTNSPFVPSALTTLDKDFVYVKDDSDLATIVSRFPQMDINQFMVASLVEEPLSVPMRIDDVMVKQVTPFIYELEQP